MSYEYSKMEHVKENFARLIRFDNIRIQKILEIGQYMLLTMVLSGYISVIIDNYMGKYDKNMSTLQLLKSILIQTIFLILGTYYIPKTIQVIPFMFQFGNYIPSKKNESKIGIAVALAMGFRAFQSNYKVKLKALKERLLD